MAPGRMGQAVFRALCPYSRPDAVPRAACLRLRGRAHVHVRLHDFPCCDPSSHRARFAPSLAFRAHLRPWQAHPAIRRTPRQPRLGAAHDQRAASQALRNYRAPLLGASLATTPRRSPRPAFRGHRTIFRTSICARFCPLRRRGCSILSLLSPWGFSPSPSHAPWRLCSAWRYSSCRLFPYA